MIKNRKSLNKGKHFSKVKKYSKKAIVYIHPTPNNTIITLTETNGNTLLWTSTGHYGYKNTKKKSKYGAQQAAKQLGRKALKTGIKNVRVVTRGKGPGRITAIRGINASGLFINALEDSTPLPHNGCRPTKRRRL
uniref:Small ribosomal subunit protein uS11c n=1 Tax=Astrosyne radiata TaxID=1158023 RepID=A0A2U9NTH5_9STRA|nr:ribosomal protein S11 [Astrosyne radiata]AWT40369.1 ribosomal protein S11 [Astrosyne radiata]|mmetsp:Transcript_29772/g.68726  ORF Transcript_29772/g.68726 Transcript_29772/m.68726 type:complete len:135 (+) Transcript_29772:282-686(+)